MQFGMPTLIENRTLEENVSLCAGLGLSFIELNMNFPEYQTDCLERTEYLTRLANDAGIYYTIHLDENLNIADFNRLVSDAYLETVRRAVGTAKALLPLRDRFGDPSQPLILNMHLNHGILITLPDRRVPLYERDIPYDGAKEMILVGAVEDRTFLTELVEAMYEDLPAPKSRK